MAAGIAKGKAAVRKEAVSGRMALDMVEKGLGVEMSRGVGPKPQHWDLNFKLEKTCCLTLVISGFLT